MTRTTWLRAAAAGGFALACAALPAHAAPPDAGAIWRDFLAHGALDTVYAGYDVLDELGYDLDQVDAEACRKQAGALADGLRKAPPSIALHHAALLCARATGDRKAEAEQSALVDALAADALSQASDIDASPPIRIVGLQDAYTLLHLADLTLAYSYFTTPYPERYFPIVMVGWDEKAKVERHLRFDVVDVADAISHGDASSGFPYQRTQLADGVLKGMSQTDQGAAIDILAVRDAYREDDDKARIEALRPAAARGGLMAAAMWIAICDLRPHAGCGDGLVDALLPQAEKRNALPLSLLAYAYVQGVGIERDDGKAEALLAAADKRWPRAGGSEAFASFWLALHHGDAPAPVQAAIAKARDAGNRNIVRDQARRTVEHQDKPVLDDADIAVLQQPAQNATGAGENILADYYRKRGDAAQALEWTRKAAAHGSADAQSVLGSAMLSGTGVPRDRDAGIAMLRDAAAGGNVHAMRVLSSLSGQDGHWQDATTWLMAGVVRSDLDAIMDLARLMEYGHAGDKLGPEQAARFYAEFGDAHGLDLAEARRRLAEMALDGRGMKKDPARARELLLHDAGKGDHDSEARLGVALLAGEFGKPDEAEGRKWMDRAMRGGNLDAYDGFAYWLYGRKTPEARKQAIETWKKAVALGHDASYNNLAWYQCASPDPAVHDAKAGLEAIEALAKKEELDAASVDTEAACYAANGDYARATKLQEEVIARVKRLQPDDPDALKQFQQRRDLYATGKPYVLDDEDD
jgi:TPR repeat protein